MFINSIYVKITNIMLSSLSRIPPWPGIKLEKSLTLYCLLMLEKNKSPIWPTIDNNNVIEIRISKLISLLITYK